MIVVQSYGEFSSRLHQQIKGQRAPSSGTIEVSRRCSLDCQHCYNNLPAGDSGARQRELSTAQHHDLVDQLVDAGCLWLLYSGGEIFIRSDFLEIYRYAASKGLFVTLFTNATLVTERIAAALAERPPFSIEITLYGATAQTYDQMTQIPGSFERCQRGIRRLLDRKLPVTLKSVATRQTRDEIATMRQMAADLGCHFKFDGMINGRVDGSTAPLATRAEAHEVVALDLADPHREAEIVRFTEQFRRPPERPEQLYQCGGGVNSFAIDPYGNLSICVLTEHFKCDLTKTTFRQAWDTLVKAERERTATRHTKCTTCQIKSLCGMCPAAARLEHGDPEEPIDFYCRVAHLRAHTMGIEVPAHGDCAYCVGGEQHAALVDAAESARNRTNGQTPPEDPDLIGGERCTQCTAGCGQ